MWRSPAWRAARIDPGRSRWAISSGSAQPGLLVHSGRRPARHREPDVGGELLRLLLEDEPREPFDQPVGDREPAVLLGDEPPFLQLPVDPVRFRVADPVAGLRLGPSSSLLALGLEGPPLLLGLPALRLGLLPEVALARAERLVDPLGQLVPLPRGQPGDRLAEVGRPDRPASLAEPGEDDRTLPPVPCGRGRLPSEESPQPRDEPGHGGPDPGHDPELLRLHPRRIGKQQGRADIVDEPVVDLRPIEAPGAAPALLGVRELGGELGLGPAADRLEFADPTVGTRRRSAGPGAPPACGAAPEARRSGRRARRPGPPAGR